MSDPNQNFQPPPPPQADPAPAAPTGPTLSAMETLTGIFFEPGRVFEALRERPRFLIAGILLIVLNIVITVALYQRVDMGQYIRDKIDKSPRAAQLTDQQKDMQVKFGKSIGMVVVPVFVPISVAAGAGLYLLAVMAFGGSLTYKRSLAVWIYSSLPPTVLATFIAVLVLLLKAPDTIDPEHLLMTNPGALMGPESSAPLTALLTQFDLVRFYGMFLAALGLRKVGKLSSGSAWAIVILFWIILAVLAVASKALFGG